MIEFPLPPGLTRCLGRISIRPRQYCGLIDECARHITIRHDKLDGTCHVKEHCCADENLGLYIPLSGFPPKDAEE